MIRRNNKIIFINIIIIIIIIIIIYEFLTPASHWQVFSSLQDY